MDFQRELTNFLDEFEPYFQKYFKEKIKEAGLYHPLIVQFYQDLADFSQGGKKIRAFLVWLGYRAGGGKDLAKILPISLAIEIFHGFLLIHDDIIDKSDLRRGKPTIHKRYEKTFGYHYGISQAIVIGDIACFEAFGLIANSKFTYDAKIECQKQIVKVLTKTGYGEALDVEYSYKNGKLSDVLKITDLKTARYSFVGPLSVGVKLSSATAVQMKAIEKFGLAAGLAFQIQDDILGVFGEEKTLGKSTLSDMREGKNTLLIHKTKQLSGEKQIIEKIWGNSRATGADLNKIKRIIEKSGALAWCLGQNRKLAGKAKVQVKKITADKRLQLILQEVADFVISRQK